MKKSMIANCITVLRIVGTIILLFLTPFSIPFYITYSLTGVTDVLDGFVARKFGIASETGAKLDSAADILFYGVTLTKLLRYLLDELPKQIWWVVCAVLIIRLCAYFTAAVKYRKFASLHTYLNKVTGLSVFLIPYFLKAPFAVTYCYAVCVIGGISSLEELFIHLTAGSYNSKKKSLLNIKSHNSEIA